MLTSHLPALGSVEQHCEDNPDHKMCGCPLEGGRQSSTDVGILPLVQRKYPGMNALSTESSRLSGSVLKVVFCVCVVLTFKILSISCRKNVKLWRTRNLVKNTATTDLKRYSMCSVLRID